MQCAHTAPKKETQEHKTAAKIHLFCLLSTFVALL